MLPLLVGELNPYGADPAFALYPLPENAAGGRLARILGLSRTEYLRRFERVNLCTFLWRVGRAREAADGLLRTTRPLVLLGSKVTRAFGLEFAPLTVVSRGLAFGRIYIVPHPSGRNPFWNDYQNHLKARELLREFLPHATPASPEA